MLVILAVFSFLACSTAAAFASGADGASSSPPNLVEVGGSGEPVRLVPQRKGFAYVSGDCIVDTPLPDGYPRPTAPGVMEIKTYPVVRRAQVTGNGDRDDGMRGRGSTAAFWPLFRHIQQRDIAMTSPVEMDYTDDGWTMAFLYRQTDQGPEGRAGSVEVFDAPPVTVISIGVRGDLDSNELNERIEALRSWVESSGEWVVAGDPRKLSYNGPDVRAARRWHEVQLPIRPADAPTP